MKTQSTADGFVQGTITDGTFRASVTAAVSCNGTPTGDISGSFQNVFTGGPGLANFTFSSNSPLIIATLDDLDFVNVIFTDVTVTDTDTNNQFLDCSAVLTAQRLSNNSWTGSIAVICSGLTLTAAGGFTGTAVAERDTLCQVLL